MEEEIHTQERDGELRNRLEALWQDMAAAGYAIREEHGFTAISIVIESLEEWWGDLAYREQRHARDGVSEPIMDSGYPLA